jgi:hypothetical protein
MHVVTFKRKFSANKNDDCADTLTGIVERMDYESGESMIMGLDEL